jgi:anti-sigma regulatory factor (Ser/Thr protein kinase)
VPHTSHRSAVTAFAAEPTSATAARRFLRQTLAGVDKVSENLRDRAELIVSELVTNAVLHAGAGPIVSIRVDDDHVRIAVEDTSASAPVLREYGLDATTGRGLQVVSSAATEWGVETTSSGKAVWAIIAMNSEDMPLTSIPPRLTRAIVPKTPNALDVPKKEPSYHVSFADVPVETYARLEAHNESLVREFSLLAIQVNGDEEEHMPRNLRQTVTMSNGIEMRFTLLRVPARAAQRQGQQAFSADIQLTSSAAENLERYVEWARQADELSARKLLLTAPSTEPVQLLREWLVREAVAQVQQASSAKSRVPESLR